MKDLFGWTSIGRPDMPRAVVLLNTDLGKENMVLEKLRSFPQIRESYFVYGVYDIVAILEASSNEELSQVVTRKIRTLPEVKSTLTMIVIE